jgi:hypothetical protein
MLSALRRVLAACLAAAACAACLRLAEVPDAWPCQTDSDCEDDQVCFKQRCAAPGSCESNLECAAGQACQNRRCQNVQCSDMDRSACGNYQCRANQCLTSCSSAADCVPGLGCAGGACVPASCQATDDAVCGNFACVALVCATACTSDLDCNSQYRCVEGDCKPKLAPDGARCRLDEQCMSGACCGETEAVAGCASTCPFRLPDGGFCSWDLQCKSRNCVDGKCGGCIDAACRTERCGTKACGMHDGTDCGTCEVGDYCDIDHCEPACEGLECGTSHGQDCGPCPAKSYCFDFQCLPACDDVECGAAHGADCGACAGKNFCDGSNTCQPACDGFECGAPLGVECGTCPPKQACRKDLWQCVPAQCPPDRAYYCDGDELYSCSEGFSPALIQDCSFVGFCFEPEDPKQLANCHPLKCEPNELFCDGSLYGKCDAVGHGATGATRDCDAEDLDCTTAGCGEHQDEPVGDCNDTFTARASGNLYAVTEDTTLLSFSQRVGGARPRFFVYESSSKLGPYQLLGDAVHEPASLVSESTSSPPLDVTLKAGRFYILGVTLAGDEDGEFCRFEAEEQALSFGTLLTDAYTTNGTLPTQITAPSGPGNTFQHVITVTLK